MADSASTRGFRLTSKQFWRLGWVLAILSISVGILGTIVYQQWNVLVEYPWDFHLLPLFTSFLVYSLDLFLVIWVWSDMMAELGYPIRFGKHVRYFCLSNLAKRLPGTVWYIAGRAQFYKEEGVPRKITSALSGIELGIMVVSGIIIGLVFGFPILGRFQINLWIVGAILLVCTVILHPRVLGYGMELLGADVHMFSYPRLLIWVGTYAIVWIGGGAMLYSICRVVVFIDFSSIGYLIGVWTLVGLLGSVFFFLPSNLGVSEVGFSLLLATLMPSPIAVVVALVIRIVPFLYEIVWTFVAIGVESGGVLDN